MERRALVVDDDLEIQRVVASALESLGFSFELAQSQEEARAHLGKHAFMLLLLDMEIPVRTGRGFSRIQNGINLLDEVKSTPATAELPVIIMTAHGKDSPELAVEVWGHGADNWINKPFPATGRTLDAVIKEVLAKKKSKAHELKTKPTRKEQAPFVSGELLLSSAQACLCGIKIGGGKNSTLMRRILEVLNQKNSHGRWRAFDGEQLAELCGAGGGQNSISSTIVAFRKDVCTQLAHEAGLAIGMEDVVETTRQGYRYSDKLTVRLEEDASIAPAKPGGVAPVPEGKRLTQAERQRWIVRQLRDGVKLRVADLTKQFKCSKRNALRDLDGLKLAGLAEYVGSSRDGYYRLRPNA